MRASALATNLMIARTTTPWRYLLDPVFSIVLFITLTSPFQDAAGKDSDTQVSEPEQYVLGEWGKTAVALRGGTSCALASSGKRMIYGHPECALVGARSGVLIARLRFRTPPQVRSQSDRRTWRFDVSGRVVIGAPDGYGEQVGLDVRDAHTGSPIAIPGALDLRPTPGTRYEWFPRGSEAPESEFLATVDLAASEGVLRCHLIPSSLRDDEAGTRPRHATLSADASLARIRDQTVPTRLMVVDRRTETVRLERSPAGSTSHFLPDGTGVVLRTNDELRCADLESGEDRWSLAIDARASWEAYPTYTFLNRLIVEVDPSGEVRTIDPDTGKPEPILHLEPAPLGALSGAVFVRDGTLLVVLARDTTDCYDARTGKRLWSGGVGRNLVDPALATVDAAEELCLIELASSRPQVVDLASGETLGAVDERSIAATSALVVGDGTSVIVSLGNGEIRLVDLENGMTEAVYQDEFGPDRGYFPDYPEARANLIVAPRADGVVRLLDSSSLELVAGARLGGRGAFTNFSPDGRYVTAVEFDPVRTKLIRLTDDLEGELVLEAPYSSRAAAFSRSGDELAFVMKGRIISVNGRTGQVLSDREITPSAKLISAAFHREDELIVGIAAEDFGRYGAFVYDTGTGAVTAELPIDDPFGGGAVNHIHSNPAAGLVILTSATNGRVEAFDDVQWESAYSHPTTGGNFGELVVRHDSASQLAAISGVSRNQARIFELASGEIVARDEVDGMFSLHVAAEGSRIIGVRDQRLTILDAETFETVLTREELRDGSAWLSNGGVLWRPHNSKTLEKEPIHIIRDGWSAPLDCFDLASFEGKELTKLPVVSRVTRRSLDGDEGAETLELEVESDARLTGVVVELPGRDDLFVEFTSQAVNDEAAEVSPVRTVRTGRVPTEWASVRVKAANGVSSRPYSAQ